MAIQGPLRVFSSLETHIAQCKRALGAIEVAQGEYEKRVAAANASLAPDQAEFDVNPEEQPSLRDSKDEFRAKIEQLGLDHESEVANYEKQHQAAFERLCDNMILSLESPMVQKSLEMFSNQSSFENEPVRTTGHSEAETLASTPRRRMSASWTSALLSIEPRHYAMVDDHMEDTIVCADDESDNKRDNKRRRTSTPRVYRRKRQRFSKEHTSGASAKSITFEDVYQNGNAAIKHTIVQYPAGDSPWFILRCDDHGLSFKNNPIKGAATHLGSEKHGHMSRTPAVAIKHLGIEVLGCNATLARKNNAVALNSYRSGSKHFVTSNAAGELKPASSPCDFTPTRQTRSCRTDLYRSPDNSSRPKHEDSDTITDPIPGEIYLAYWEMSRVWSPVLVLPQERLDNVGVSDTLEDLGLIATVPKCYRYDQRMKKLKWRGPYEDGQPLVAKRQFPVMYFDGLKFPEKCSVGWVAAADLRVLDIDASKASLIPNHKSMRAFLRKRAATESGAVDVSLADEKISETNFNQHTRESADSPTLVNEEEDDSKTIPFNPTMDCKNLSNSSGGLNVSPDLLINPADSLVSSSPAKQPPDDRQQDEQRKDEKIRVEEFRTEKSPDEQLPEEQTSDEQLRDEEYRTKGLADEQPRDAQSLVKKKPDEQPQQNQPRNEDLLAGQLRAEQSRDEGETQLDEYLGSSTSSEEDHDMCCETDVESISSAAVLDEAVSNPQGFQTPPLQNGSLATSESPGGYMATPPPSTTQIQPRRSELALSHLSDSQIADTEDLGHEQNQSDLGVFQSIPFRPMPTFTLPGLRTLNLEAIGTSSFKGWPELEMSGYKLPPIDPTRQLRIHPPTLQRHGTVMSPVDCHNQDRLLSKSPRTLLPTGSSSPNHTMGEPRNTQGDPGINKLQTSSSTTQRRTLDPPDSTQLGVHPFLFKPHILDELSSISKSKYKHPAFGEFRNSRGFLRCPLKHRTSRGAEFVHIRSFANHLRSQH
ncbi:hypothetical protein B0J13DRAFT_645008 [Dactylonectria estremocensis]|uniref:Uncharacterized protein n=1 Tax=Dactylonectria estremocensis TaxID=1079267 RepID=A0A9P9E0G6_9HYPO|nr:hypothetical protein B0J13DRAFT_645008 [Dactylonectria estremocensis]